MKALTAYLLLGLPAISSSLPQDFQCFSGFATLSAGEESFYLAVGRTYGDLLTTDANLRRPELEKLLAAEDPLSPEALEPNGSPLLKRRFREFRIMVDSRGADVARIRDAIRAALTEAIRKAKEGLDRQRQAVEDAGHTTVRNARLGHNVETLLSPDGRWTFQRNGSGERPWALMVTDTVKDQKTVIRVPAGYSSPHLTPDGKELVFIEYGSKIVRRVPFANGQVDWSAAKEYGPFPDLVTGGETKWVPGAEPHLVIGAGVGPQPVPFQYDLRTNTMTNLKASPPFLILTGYFSGVGHDGVMRIHRHGSVEDELLVYRVDKEGNARQVGETVKAKSNGLSEVQVALEKGGGGYVYALPFFEMDGKFKLHFVNFNGKPAETVPFPELDRPRARYKMISHPTRNGVLVLADDRHPDNVSTAPKINRAFWIDLDTRKASRVAVDHLIKRRDFITTDVFFVGDGKELAIQNGLDLSVVNFYPRIME